MAVFSHFLQKMGVNVFIFYSKENTAIVLVFIMYDGN